MTIKELIEKLKQYPEDTKVLVWDEDSGCEEPVTGFMYDSELEEICLCSDNMQDIIDNHEIEDMEEDD